MLYLVASFGNINPTIDIQNIENNTYKVSVSSTDNYENVNIKTESNIAQFSLLGTSDKPSIGKSFSMEANTKYHFLVSGENDLKLSDISIINQDRGYSNAMYLMSVFLAILLLITFLTTKERVQPPKAQTSNLKQDFKDLISNKPWLILLIVGLLFNIYNSIKQGIVVIYFTHYLNDQLLTASFLIGLMIASIFGAMITAPLSKVFGKKKLFIYALLFSGTINSLFLFCSPDNLSLIHI